MPELLFPLAQLLPALRQALHPLPKLLRDRRVLRASSHAGAPKAGTDTSWGHARWPLISPSTLQPPGRGQMEGPGAALTCRWLCSARSTSAISRLFCSRRVEGSSVAASHVGTVPLWITWRSSSPGGENTGRGTPHCGMARTPPQGPPVPAGAQHKGPGPLSPRLGSPSPTAAPRGGQVTAQPHLSD